MTLEFELPLFSFLFILMLDIVYFSKKKINLIENKVYSNILIFSTIASFLDTILHINGATHTYDEIITYYLPFANALNKIINMLFILVVSSLLIYILLITYEKFKKNIKKIFIPIAIFDMVCFVIMLFTEIKVLRIGEVTNVTGTTPLVGYLAVALLLFVSLALTLLNISKVDKRYISIFIILPLMLVFYCLTLMFPGIIIYDLILAILCYIMFFTIENPDLKLVRQLELANIQAEKSNRAKSDFLSSMSHEIRTPLNAIVGLSNAIDNTDDIKEIHEDTKDIISASNTLLEIVNGILDINKIEADKMDIVETNYRLEDEFNAIVKAMKGRIETKDIELTTNYNNIPDTLYGDIGKIKQIVTNLLSNAIKYTEKGYVKLNVDCIIDNDNYKLIIKVSDTGRGIKKENINDLFTKFNRLESDKNSTISGTGLGLAITKSLVTLLGGEITVDSTYEKGSTFTVTINQNKKQDIEETSINQNTHKFEHKKVLIVDDNKLNIKVTTKLLNNYHFTTHSVMSGKECLSKVNNNYDLILMDIMMPDMDGIETFNKLKEQESFNIPVIALTADAMEGSKDKYLKLGFTDYLSKPIDNKKLNDVLNRIFEQEKDISYTNTIEPITDEQINLLNKKLEDIND